MAWKFFSLIFMMTFDESNDKVKPFWVASNQKEQRAIQNNQLDLNRLLF